MAFVLPPFVSGVCRKLPAGSVAEILFKMSFSSFSLTEATDWPFAG